MVATIALKRAIPQERIEYISEDDKSSTSRYFTPSQKEWLDELSQYENCPTIGMVDSNGKKSYGDYCYQEDTFIRLVKKYREKYELIPYAEDQEIFNFISDNSFQRKLTEIVLLEESDKTITNMWFTTIKIKGLQIKRTAD